MAAILPRLKASSRALRAVVANPNLRRVQLARAGSVVSGWAYAVALSVFAFDAGGTTAVGIVGLIVMLPAAMAAPFAALLADRHRRERVLLLATLLRAVALAGVATAMLAQNADVVVYVLAALASVLARVFSPAAAALLPSLAQTPDELAAANVTSSAIDSVGLFVGPALGGLLLASTSPGFVVGLTAGTLLITAAVVTRIRTERRPAPARTRTETIARDFGAGFRTIAGEPRLRLLIGLYGAQTLAAGALNVLIVVSAFKLLGLGKAGVGYVNSAFGAGALIGAPAALILVGRKHVASRFALGMLLWAFPIALVALWPIAAVALALFAAVGIGNTIIDVAIFTLLQRGVADDVLARVFGVLEGLTVGTIGIGSVVAPLLVAAFSDRGALLALGVSLALLTALVWPRIAALDAASPAPDRALALLRSVPFFSALPAATLAELAQHAQRIPFPAATTIVTEGNDTPDRFYVIDEGTVHVTAAGALVAALGPGDYFGEIALLRNVPRVASVEARTDVVAYALERPDFLSAVTGHPASAEAAGAAVATRLRSLRPGLAPLGS